MALPSCRRLAETQIEEGREPAVTQLAERAETTIGKQQKTLRMVAAAESLAGYAGSPGRSPGD